MPKKRTKQDHVELLAACARLFYEDGLSKTEIGKQLGFSGTHVRRLLDEARDKGIVRIRIVEEQDFALIQAQLVAAFSLKMARIAPSSRSYESQKAELGKAAAVLFDEIVSFGSTVGIGGGGSLKALVDQLPRQPRTIHIAPTALVGRGPAIEHVDAAFLAFRLHDKSAPKASASAVGMLPGPQNPDARSAFEQLVETHIPEVEQVLQVSRSAETVFVGLGGPSPVPELVPVLDRTGITTRGLQKRQAAGGINYNYFDKTGAEIATLFKTIRIRELKTMSSDGRRNVVAVAGGAHKREALEIALRGAFVNCVVTDEQTARLLIAAQRSTAGRNPFP